jgi:transposase InsO family protein
LEERDRNIGFMCSVSTLQTPERHGKCGDNSYLRHQGALWETRFFGRLIKSYRGYEYAITAIDYATLTAITKPLKMRPAEAVVQLLEKIIWTYGKPSEIITDNGAGFRSDEFYAVKKRHGIRHSKASPGHPQTNGKVERLKYELIQRLQRISAEEAKRRRDWDL